MEAFPVKVEGAVGGTGSNVVENEAFDPLANGGVGMSVGKGVGGVGMLPPPLMPPFGPMLFPPVAMLKKKKWADAPKEFPTSGEGYPFPQGGWAYGQSVGKPYDFMKSDGYVSLMKEAAKRTTMQLAYVYLLDVQPAVATFVDLLTDEMRIVLVESNDALDASESVVSRFFSANNIPHKALHLNDLVTVDLDPKQTSIILCDTLHSSEVENAVVTALKAFVSHGGLLLSFNNAISIISNTFQGKLKPRLGATTIDKPIAISARPFPASDQSHFQQYEDIAKAHKQLVRIHGLQRFEVIDSKNSVSSIITESAPQAGQPLVVSFQFGQGKNRGTVYHSTATHLVAKIGPQGGNSFQPLTDMLPAQSLSLANKCIEDLNKIKPTPHKTIAAWQAAVKCGFPSCINIALSYYPFLDSLFSILIAHSQQ